MDKIPGGYILLARKTLTSGIMNKPPLYLKLWIYIMLKATKKPCGDLKPGQFRASIADMQEATSYFVGARKRVPTIKEIRRALDWLRCPHERVSKGIPKGIPKGIAKGAMIITTRGIAKSLITVVNYEYYQDPSNYKRHRKKEDEGRSEGHSEGRTERTSNGQTGALQEQEVLQEEQIKTSEKVFSEDSAEYKLAALHIRLLEKNNHPWRKNKKPDIQKWALQYDGLTRIDKVDPKIIQDVLLFAMKDKVNDGRRWKGWARVILSPNKLRERWEEVSVQMQAKQEPEDSQATFKTCTHPDCRAAIAATETHCPVCMRKL